MQKESIEEARKIIITSLNESMLNINHFLENYNEMIKVKVKKK